MSGAPNFGGLSSVLLAMYSAYYLDYQVTTLYDVMVLKKTVDTQNDTLELVIAAPYQETAQHNLLINMGNSNTTYQLSINSKPTHNMYRTTMVISA
jgi:hypothetical protein